MKIAFVVHEAVIAELIEAFPGEQISPEPDDFEFASWARKPNSTLRLTLTNLEAVRRLQAEGFNIQVMADRIWSDRVAEKYRSFDLVVLNTVASEVSVKFTRKFLSWLESGETRPDVVFGTETTWRAVLARKQITLDEFEKIHNRYLLLRHTARTERELARKNKIADACIQEFEIGFDESLFPAPLPFSERNLILLVRAPEGRVTKNNEAISSIVRKLKSNPSLSGFDVVELSPPYSLAEYWNLLSETAFLVFTSNGETFSYVLNDAKAMGVVTLFPEQLYRTRISERVWVDSYPQLGIRYRNEQDAIQKLVALARFPERATLESEYSRESAIQSFGIDKITSNWRKLLSKESLNTNVLLIHGGSLGSKREVESVARAFGASAVFPFRNLGYVGARDGSGALDRATGLIYFADPFADLQGANLRGDSVLENETGKEATLRFGEITCMETYIQLLVRVHKVGAAVISNALKGSEIDRVLQSINVISDWEARHRKLQLTWGDF